MPPIPKKSPLHVMYVEVNDTNFGNAACYSLRSADGEPLFDIAIIFAANINYNFEEKRAVLFFNENVEKVLSNVELYVRPIQARGTKVLLSILGNHQGAGFCNFPDVDAARQFAQQLSYAVYEYGLDGIDFDDEYADYGENGTGQPNADSFLLLLRELRELMPDKIISFYFYGPASTRLQTDELNAGDYLDYSWNAVYGTYDPPRVPKLGLHQLAPAAVNVLSTNLITATALAQRTLNEGYGVYLSYSLPNKNHNLYLSAICNALYGVSSVVDSECLGEWVREGEKKNIVEGERSENSVDK